MTIKQYAFQAHTHLRAQGLPSLTRSQVHELLAAAAGFVTHASLQHEAAWCDVPWRAAAVPPDENRVVQRCLQFGLSPEESARAAQGLICFVAASGYAPLRFEELIAALEDNEDEWADAEEAEPPAVATWISAALIGRMDQGLETLLEEFPLLLEGLEAATARGVAAAHLATAYMFEPYAGLPEDEDRRFGRELRRCAQWSVEPVSLAEITAGVGGFARVVAKHRYHLLAAARCGDRRAMLVTAERYGDPSALELEPSDEMDPHEMADLADAHGRHDLGYQWRIVLACEGDVSAMRELIEHRGETLFRVWVWMHLSRMLGQDLSQDRYEAINEDGTLYDDDVGGPSYVGGVGGIELAPLAAEENVRAKDEAAQLFAAIEKRYHLT